MKKLFIIAVFTTVFVFIAQAGDVPETSTIPVVNISYTTNAVSKSVAEEETTEEADSEEESNSASSCTEIMVYMNNLLVAIINNMR